MTHPPSTEPNRSAMRRLVLIAIAALLSTGCTTLPKNDVADAVMPSNFRNWSPEFAVLPTVEIVGDEVTVRNVRNISYLTEEDYVLQFEDRSYDLSKLETVDFFVVPFASMPMMAHTMISFGFADGDYLAVSAEIRTEKGEKYSPILGVSRQYEITYVAADERDIVRLRTRYRDADVYLYRTLASPEKARQLFHSVATRINKLAEQPEFYDTIRNNCTTNIVRHVNEIAPSRVPYSVGVLLPGYADRYAYDLGLLDQSLPFAQLKQKAWINDLADRYFDDPDFSQKIRRRTTGDGWKLRSIEIGEEINPDFDLPATNSDTPSKPQGPQETLAEGEGWVKRTGFSEELIDERSSSPGRLEPIPMSATRSPSKASQRPPANPGWFDLRRWSHRQR